MGFGPTFGVMNAPPGLCYTDDTSPLSSSNACSVSSSICYASSPLTVSTSSSSGWMVGFSCSTTCFASFASAESRRQ